jgi:hypothetical protein
LVFWEDPKDDDPTPRLVRAASLRRAAHVWTTRIMDLYTRFPLGLTAVAVPGHISFVYGSCASDPDCHFRLCAGGRQFCGVIHTHVQENPTP